MKYTVIKGEQDKAKLMELVPFELFDAKRREAFKRMKRPLKIPSYEHWVENVLGYAQHSTAAEHNAYYLTYPVFVQFGRDQILPLIFTRDEQVHDKRVIIPTILFDVYSVDHVHMWGDVDELSLREIGLKSIPKGISNPLVYTKDLAALKRFNRYKKLVKDWRIVANSDLMLEILEAHMPAAREYWADQGVKTTISNDNLEMYWGENKCIHSFVIEIEQTDGCKGAGFFTIQEPNEIYWDFSRRGIGNHVGNNILLMAAHYGAMFGYDYLNLGVGFYNWKTNWSHGLEKWVPGVEFLEGGEMQELANYLLAEIGEPYGDGFNKERVVA